MPLWVLSGKVVRGPIVFLRDTLHLYGHRITSFAHDHDIYAFLVSKRQTSHKAAPMKARENVELGGEIRVVS